MEEKLIQTIDSENFNPLKVAEPVVNEAGQEAPPQETKKPFFRNIPPKLLILLGLGIFIAVLAVVALIVSSMRNININLKGTPKPTPTPKSILMEAPADIPPAYQGPINNLQENLNRNLHVPQLDVDSAIGL